VSFSVEILGASSAVPNPDRATSGYLLRSGASEVLLECGHGVVGKLLRYGSVEDLDGVVISHMHPDHCFDLVALRNYVYCNGLDRLPLYVPSNGPQVLRDVALGLQLSAGYFDETFEVRSYPGDAPFTIGTMEFRTIRTVHNTVAYAMRVQGDSGGRLVFSSDTAYFPEFAGFAAGCEVLLVETTDPVPPAKRPRWHLSPAEVAAIVRAAGPGLTLLTHYVAAHAEEILKEVSGLCPDSLVRLAAEGERHVIGA
jgi:ribonuclease BN (tRNA processing enzyme)